MALDSQRHFESTEEYIAVSGGKDRKPDAGSSDFVAPVFRGFLGNETDFYKMAPSNYPADAPLER